MQRLGAIGVASNEFFATAAGPGQISSGPAVSIPTPSSGWKVKSFLFKNELGLDHNQTRSWHGWHRHVSLVMLAFAMMATIRHEANAALPKTTRRTGSGTRR